MPCSSALHSAISSVSLKSINNMNKSLERDLVLGALTLSPAQNSYFFLSFFFFSITSHSGYCSSPPRNHPLKVHVFPQKRSLGCWWALITSREFKTQASASESEISLAIQSTQPGTAWRKTPHNEFSEAESLPTAASNIPPMDLLTLLNAT